MRRTWRALMALGVGVLIGGCEDKKDTSPVADPAVTAVTATPSSSAASVVKAEPAVNRYFHAHTLPGVVSSFAVGTAVVVCDGGCTAPKAEKAPPPTMWLVETESVKKDPSLWPGNAFYDQLHRVRMSEDDDLGGLPRFTFDGEYPGDLYAHWVGGNTGERVPSWGHLPPAKYRGKHWGLVDMQTERTNRREKEVPPLPPEVETLVASAPVTEGAPRERLVHGGGAPVMAIEAQRIHIHGEGGWRSVDAPLPGSVAQRARLTDGAT
ncbi:MAG: hypothetical protein KC731_08455, partial [Myxococcales bacterium]|nr:hypothetical protein [Myxococcales bacterium]